MDCHVALRAPRNDIIALSLRAQQSNPFYKSSDVLFEVRFFLDNNYLLKDNYFYESLIRTKVTKGLDK